MGSDGRIDKDDVLATNSLWAVAELSIRTSRLEARLREGAKTLIQPERLPRRVDLAAQHLRDWGLNAEAEEMMGLWGKFYSEWASSTADYDESLPDLLAKLNQWLFDRQRQWMISAGHTLDDLKGNENKPPVPGKRHERKTVKQNRGRPVDTDLKKDKRIYEAWKTGSYKTQADCGREFDMTGKEARLAIDRHRKRLERKGKK